LGPKKSVFIKVNRKQEYKCDENQKIYIKFERVHPNFKVVKKTDIFSVKNGI
jgi:hypothetical protein